MLQIIEMIDKLKSQNKLIKLCWVPSHMGIKVNEKADEAAKSALLLPIKNLIHRHEKCNHSTFQESIPNPLK